MTQLIIGDIHGCYYELQALLDKSAIGDDDEIIALGDLFDRGPEPREVYDFFRRTPNARSIRGNHEWNHIRATQGDIPPRVSALITRWQLDNDYPEFLDWVSCLPLYLDLPSALLVHGFLEPDIALDEQEQSVLLGVTSAEKYLENMYEHSWYTYYNSEKPLIVGHRDYSGTQEVFQYEDKVWGIDTRCVYGGSLTGVVLPDFNLISVPARRDHWSKLQRKHGIE